MDNMKSKYLNTASEELLSPKQAAKILMVSPITIRKWAQKNKLKAFTTAGGHRRFRLKDLKEFAEQNNVITPDYQPQKVLIIDDDDQILKFLTQMFDDIIGKKIIVKTATNGFDGGLKIHSFKPDFLLLDLKMQGIDGFEVCKQVKQNELTSHIRILTMTGFLTQECTDEIIALGAESCFSKPININELLIHMGLINE